MIEQPLFPTQDLKNLSGDQILLFNILIVCTAGGDGGAWDNAPYKVGPLLNTPQSEFRFL